MVRGQGLELDVIGIDPPGHVGSVPVARAQVAGREAVRSRPLSSVVGARHPAEDPTDVRDAHPSLRPRERRPPDERQDTDDDGREHPGARPEQTPGPAPGARSAHRRHVRLRRRRRRRRRRESRRRRRRRAGAILRQVGIGIHHERSVFRGPALYARTKAAISYTLPPLRLVAPGPPLIESDPYGPVSRTTRRPWPGSRTGPAGAAPTARACSRARRRRRRPFGAQCRKE